MPKWGADAYITILNEYCRGKDGKYYLTTTGCGCCSDYDIVTKEEYLKILEDLIKLAEKEIEKVKNNA